MEGIERGGALWCSTSVHIVDVVPPGAGKGSRINTGEIVVKGAPASMHYDGVVVVIIVFIEEFS